MSGRDLCRSRGDREVRRLSSTGVQASNLNAQSRVLGSSHRRRDGHRASFGSEHGHDQRSTPAHATERIIDDLAAEDEVIAAIDMKSNGALGCAVYSPSGNSMSILEDVSSANLELIESLMIHTQPSTILLQNRAPEMVTEYLERHANAVVDGEPSVTLPTFA